MPYNFDSTIRTSYALVSSPGLLTTRRGRLMAPVPLFDQAARTVGGVALPVRLRNNALPPRFAACCSLCPPTSFSASLSDACSRSSQAMQIGSPETHRIVSDPQVQHLSIERTSWVYLCARGVPN